MLVVDSERIPAAKLTDVSSWTLPEIGTQKIVYEATQEGVNSAQLPALGAGQSTEDNGKIGSNNSSNTGRLRVTEEQLEALLKEAREQAYHQGFEQGRGEGERQGYQEGTVKAGNAMDSALSAVHGIEAQLPAVMNIHNQREQQLIVQLLEKLVRSVTQAELTIGRANMERIVSQAINCLADADQVIAVRVAPADYDFLTTLPGQNNWQYIADESLSSGDCIVEARRSLLDHSVEHRIAEALAALRSQFESAL